MSPALLRFAAGLMAFTLLTGCNFPDATQLNGTASLVEVRSASATQLNVGYQPQETMLCVPTSASMVMRYYGDWEPPRKLKMLSRGIGYDPAAPFSDFTITLYSDLVKAASALGYSWSERDYPDDEAGFLNGLAAIRSELMAGHPVLVDVSMPAGHTVVAAGFDEPSQSLLVVDPNSSDPGRYSISYGRLHDIWNEHAFGGHIRSLVLTSPLQG